MVKIISLNCRSCGGSLDKSNKCEYCGTEHIILHKVEKKYENGGATFSCGVTGATGHNQPFKFEVENVNGKIKINSEQYKLNKQVGLIRVSNCSYISLFKYKEYLCICSNALQQGVYDIPVGNLLVGDINDFDFSDLKKDSKIEVILFPTYSIEK